MKRIVIIGAGPAGLSAALYAARGGAETLIVERAPLPGGQMLLTDFIDNYAGVAHVSGFDLAEKMKEQCVAEGVRLLRKEASSVKFAEKQVCLSDGEILDYDALILCTGASRRNLEVPGEAEFAGRGVSYCATCDGAFFRKKEVVVAGGGTAALEDALYLARLCSRVTLIHRRDAFRAPERLVQEARDAGVSFVTPAKIASIAGTQKVERVLLEDGREIPCSGVFIAIGGIPNSQLAETLARDAGGYLVCGSDLQTSQAGVFAAGDVVSKAVRQVATAVGDGAIAAGAALQV